MTSGEQDFTKRSKAFVDLMYVKSVLLQDPSIAACVPTSIENPALAYDSENDRFKVDIEALSVGVIPVSFENDWTRELGQVDLARVLGAALTHDNPVIVRLTNGTTWLDPTNIRALTSSDKITAYGSLDTLQQRTTTKDLFVQIRHEGSEKDPTAIRALTTSDKITPEQSDETKLKATVTQAAKDRTLSDITKVTTTKQLDLTFAGAENQTAWDPAEGKKVRLKFISFELSADVDLGYRWGAAGTIFYMRTTKGPYVANLIGCNDEGAADDILYFYASGACTVKGHLRGEEI